MTNASVAIDQLADTVDLDGSERYMRELIALTREHLGLDIAYVGELTDTEEVIHLVEGDPSSFGFAEGQEIALHDTYCQRVVEGEIPSLITDAQHDESVMGLPATSDSSIGAYVGVPIHFSDGRLYGTLCTISHAAAPELRERDLAFVRIIARLIGDFLEREELAGDRSRLETEAAGTEALVAALAARDGYTVEHSAAVVHLCESVAAELDMTGRKARSVSQVGLLHDIGKVGIPDAILRKRASLTDDEWKVMKTHPDIGRTIIEATTSLAHLGPAIAAEHERWDGRGYPRGLQGEEIPIESRIVLACDAWHAMTSTRPYRKAMPRHVATGELIKGVGSQFDAFVVSALLRVLGGTEPVPFGPR